MLLTRSPLEYPQAGLSVRLACVKHAASVRPEPGSNSPLNAYRQDPERSQSTKIEKTPNPHPKAGIRCDHSPKHEQTLANLKQHKTNKHVRTPNPANTPLQRRHANKTQHQTHGTDFRYAVEFSKNGRAPSPVSQPAWGQPCKHYPVRSAVSNCPARSALLAANGAQPTDPCGCDLRGGVAPRPLEGP